MPCSMDRTPLRTATLIPSVACACAITLIPAAVASATIVATSSSRKWPCRGSSRADSTPPLVAALITSAPARTSSRTTRRTCSGPSTTVSGRPGCGCTSGTEQPEGYQPSPCPPSWTTTSAAAGAEPLPSNTCPLAKSVRIRASHHEPAARGRHTPGGTAGTQAAPAAAGARRRQRLTADRGPANVGGVKPADLALLRLPGAPTLSPDGRRAVLAVTRLDLDADDY